MGALSEAALRAIERGNRWLDGECGQDYKDQPLAQDWARAAKAGEEAGEVIRELICWTGQNPRKVTDPAGRERMMREMGDGAASFLLAIQHFTGDLDQTDAYLAAALDKVRDRAKHAGY
jgi:hypothetical protein